jgi:BON domain-containing protein
VRHLLHTFGHVSIRVSFRFRGTNYIYTSGVQHLNCTKAIWAAHALGKCQESSVKTISLSVSLFFLAVVLSLGAGCAKKPDDAKIAGDIQSKFSQDSGLSAKQLTVQSNDGTVTLAGTVDNDSQREAASRQAASVTGVKQVINNLQVGTAAAAPIGGSAEPPATSPSAVSKPEPSRRERKSRKSHAAENDRGAAMSAGSGDAMANNSASQPAQQITPPPPTPAPPPPPKKMIIDQGTQLSVRLVDPIDSEKDQAGQTFHATLNTPLTSDGEEVVPAGSDVVGHIAELKSAGKFAGQSVVVLQLDSITSGGRTYNIQTDQYKKQGSSRGKNTAEKVGGGAAIGAIIGAIAGGGKGAAIGAAAGGGVGGGVQAATKSQQIKLPSETVLNFTLQAAVTVIQAPNPNSNRQKLGDAQ